MNDSDRRSLAEIVRALEAEDPDFAVLMGAQGWTDTRSNARVATRRRRWRAAAVLAIMILLLAAAVVLLVLGAVHSAAIIVAAASCVVVADVATGCWLLMVHRRADSC